jgi:protein-histidine pros-kinase
LKLLAKFNILLIVIFSLGLGLIALNSHSFLQKEAREQVLSEAQLMSASATATRNYTEQDVSPLLEKTAEHASNFLPETIPFFAATATFAEVRKSWPDYTYKEAALNPTNPRDRAVEWEADLIQYFRNSPAQTEFSGERDTPTGRSFYLAHPIRVEAGCLECHSRPAVAPRAMIKHYGSQNGFGWNPNEIVGAQIISVPTSIPDQLAARGLRSLMINLAGIFLLSIVLIDIGLFFVVIRPLRRISNSADRISTGEIDLDLLPVRGKDELASVTQSFNRMHTSLKKAMELLQG